MSIQRSVILEAIVSEGLMDGAVADLWLERFSAPVPAGTAPWDKWLNEEWRKSSRNTQSEIRDYYDGDAHVVFQAQQCGSWESCSAQAEWRVTDLSHATVLDFGCGSGRDGISCLKEGSAVTFCDASRRLLTGIRRVCSDHGRSVEILGDEDQLGESRFDLIITTDAFEHLVDPPSWLRRLVASLRVNGFMSQRAFFGTHELAPYHLDANVILHSTWADVSRAAGLEPVVLDNGSPYQGLWRRVR